MDLFLDKTKDEYKQVQNPGNQMHFSIHAPKPYRECYFRNQMLSLPFFGVPTSIQHACEWLRNLVLYIYLDCLFLIYLPLQHPYPLDSIQSKDRGHWFDLLMYLEQYSCQSIAVTNQRHYIKHQLKPHRHFLWLSLPCQLLHQYRGSLHPNIGSLNAF